MEPLSATTLPETGLRKANSLAPLRVSEHQSTVAAFYGTRNHVLFTRTYYPEAFPFVIGASFMSGVHQLLKGQDENHIALARGAIYEFRATHPGREQT